jgi:hypothetical protein
MSFEGRISQALHGYFDVHEGPLSEAINKFEQGLLASNRFSWLGLIEAKRRIPPHQELLIVLLNRTNDILPAGTTFAPAVPYHPALDALSILTDLTQNQKSHAIGIIVDADKATPADIQADYTRILELGSSHFDINLLRSYNR